MINSGERHSVGNVDATFVLFGEFDVRRFFVNTNAKAFKFRFDDSLVDQRLVDIEDDEDQVASFGHGYNLSSPPLAIFCSLNDTRKVQNLDLGAIVNDLARDGRELIAASEKVAREPSFSQSLTVVNSYAAATLHKHGRMKKLDVPYLRNVAQSICSSTCFYRPRETL